MAAFYGPKSATDTLFRLKDLSSNRAAIIPRLVLLGFTAGVLHYVTFQQPQNSYQQGGYQGQPQYQGPPQGYPQQGYQPNPGPQTVYVYAWCWMDQPLN
jgi:hypothetical protein